MTHSGKINKKGFRIGFILIPLLGIICFLYVAYLFNNVVSDQHKQINTFVTHDVEKIKKLGWLYSEFSTNHARLSGLLAETSRGRDEGELYDISVELLDSFDENINAFVAIKDQFDFSNKETELYGLLLSTLQEYFGAARSAIEMTTVDVSLASENIVYANNDFIKADKYYNHLLSELHNSNNLSFKELRENSDDSLINFFFAVVSALLFLIAATAIIFRYSSQKAIAIAEQAKQLREQNATINKQRNQVTALLDGMNDGYLLFDKELNLLEANEKAITLLSESYETLRGNKLWDVLPETASGFYRPFKTSLSNLDKLRFNAPYPPCNIWLDVETYPDENGMAVFFRDITEQRNYTKSIERSEKRIRSIVDNALEGIITINQQGIIDSFNKAAQHIFGYQLNEVVGKNISMLMPIEHGRQHNQYINKYLKTGISKALGVMRQFEAKHKDGRVFPIEISTCEINIDGQKGFTGVIRDISDRIKAQKEAEMALLAKHAAESASSAKSMFLANMSHEIRTPLTAITGFAELLLDSDQSIKERTEAIKTIITNGNHLQTIINDILDLSKIEANKLEIQAVSFSLFELVNDLNILLKSRANENGLEFNTNYQFPLPPKLDSDPIRIKQVLINLIGNAIKFTRKGHINLNIGFDAAENTIVFSVEDTGIGMTAEQQEKIFNPFTQADSSTTRQYGGTGLGLTLSKQLAELLKGDLTVSSQIHQGSCFTFTINAGQIDDKALVHEVVMETNNSQNEKPASIQLLAGHVLVADDNKANQQLITRYISKTGASIAIANNGKEAIEHTNRQAFDLILMDMQMPVMGGLEATKTLRESGYDKPIVALTANASRENKRICLNSGCNDFLTKPIQRNNLYNVLSEFLPKEAQPVNAPPITSELLKLNPDFVQLLSSYVDTLPQLIIRIKKACQEANAEQTSELVQELKNSGGSYGYPELVTIAGKMQFQIINEDFSNIETLIDELEFMTKGMRVGLNIHNGDDYARDIA